MSNYNTLKTTINANIKQNGNQEITGQILNSVLNQMVTTLGAGYQFAGVATTATNPGTPDAKVFYIANGKGTYTNFGGLEVTEDEVVVLYYDTEWHKVATGIASQAKLTELSEEISNIEKDVNNGLSAVTDSYEKAPYNLWDGQSARYERSQSTGEILRENEHYWCFANPVEVSGNTEITITQLYGTIRKMVGGYVFCYDENENFISVIKRYYADMVPITLPADTKYIIYQSDYSGTEAVVPNDLMCSPYVEDWEYREYEEYIPLHRVYVPKVNPEDVLNKSDLWSEPMNKVGGRMGSHVQYGRGVVDDFIAVANSLDIIQAQSQAVKLGNKRRHEPQMVVVGDTIYLVCYENLEGYADDAKSHGKVLLSLVNAETLELINEYDVSAAGMPVGSDTLEYGGGDPNIVHLDSDTVRMIWDAKLTLGGEICLFYRDFKISTKTLTDIGVCQIKNDVATYNFDFTGIQEVCGHWVIQPDNGINMDCQYAKIDSSYYIGLGVGAAYANIPILRTNDFATFELWTIPTLSSNHAKYECSLLYYNPIGVGSPNWLLSATRQTDGNILIMPIKVDTKKTLGSYIVPSGGMRPYLFLKKDEEYMVGMFHTLGGSRRAIANITTFNCYGYYDEQNYYMTHELGSATYVTICKYNNMFIMAYQSDNRIKITKIPTNIYQYNWENLIPKLRKLLQLLA